MSARSGPMPFGFAVALFLFTLLPVSLEAAPLCNPSLEQRIARLSRKAFERFVAEYPEYSSTASRERFGDGDRQSFVFTNRSQRPAVSRFLLVLPGSGFHPAFMLRALEPTVPDDTELAVFEYPYLSPDFDPDGPFVHSEQVAADIAAGLEARRRRHGYERVGIYASSLGGSLVAKMMQSGTRVDFLVLDGVQESRPLPWSCSSNGWLRDVLPPLLPSLPRVILITNRNDRKERTKTLRKIPTSPSYSIVELDARHPWETDQDADLRRPVLQQVFKGLL